MRTVFTVILMPLAAALCLLAAAEGPREKWEIQFMYERSDSHLTVTDLKFPSAQRGIAAGFLESKVGGFLLGTHEKASGVVLVTSNGGHTWDQFPVKEVANSLFFLDDTNGWLVGENGLWFTDEAGRSWKRVSSVKHLAHVYFLSRTHGFAVGDEGRANETNDGGATWRPLSVDPPPDAKTKNLDNYNVVAFGGQELGLITGAIHEGNDEEQVPSWMDAESENRRTRRTANLFLRTKDGGKSWVRSARSLYGEITRLSFAQNGDGLALIEAPPSYPFPSEVCRFNIADNQLTPIGREANRAITDVLLTSSGRSYAAGYEPPGRVHPSPVPGKVRILRAVEFSNWSEMQVDYRASARRVILAAAGENVWAATDTGIILNLHIEQ